MNCRPYTLPLNQASSLPLLRYPLALVSQQLLLPALTAASHHLLRHPHPYHHHLLKQMSFFSSPSQAAASFPSMLRPRLSGALHRRWYRSHHAFFSVREDVVIRERRRCGMWGQTDMNKLGLGFETWRERVPRRELLSTVVAARRSVLHELQNLRKDETDYSGQIEYESPLQVVLYPDSRLRAKNKIVNVFDEKLQQLVQEMFDIMYKTDGVGLAAPQVGVNVRLMVYNPMGERGQGEEYVLVNPQIVKYGKNQDVFAEGCLSFPTFGSDPKKAPTIEADVERPKSVRVEAQDVKGKKFAMTLKEWQARIFQHEYDHLEGTLYFDRMSPEVLDSIRPDLKKLEELYEQRTGLSAPEKISNKK